MRNIVFAAILAALVLVACDKPPATPPAQEPARQQKVLQTKTPMSSDGQMCRREDYDPSAL